MQRISHGALIYVSTDLVGGARRAQSFLQILQKKIRVAGISSVYKRFLSPEQVDLNSTMNFALRIITDFGPETLLAHLLDHEIPVELTLLCYDDLILMSPQLTLPYPALHTDPLIIRCAAEAWGPYEHPVYQKTLSELARNTTAINDAEFFLQGRSLIDI